MSNKNISEFVKTTALTALALVAFASNSVLCRMALGEKTIDAASFTTIRVLSGAVVLLIILQIKRGGKRPSSSGSWNAAMILFLYAAPFSFAYITLNTGTGALILFGAVQITMIFLSLLSGNRLNLTEWIGAIIAFAGFVYLVLPGVSAPSPGGFLLMALAGIAWGIYTLKGRTSVSPLSDTAFNFTRSLPLALILGIFAFHNGHLSGKGVLLAVLSGGVASGIGYTIWYTALRGLSSIQAAVVQLSVPVIAAAGGVVFISERITLRLTLSALMILGGILAVMLGKYGVKSSAAISR